jgi:hypothetical protein
MIKLPETENLRAHDLFDAVLTVLEDKELLLAPGVDVNLMLHVELIENNIQMQMLADPVGVYLQFEALKLRCSTQLVRALELKCRAQYQHEYLGMHLKGMFKELNIYKVTDLLERLFQFYCKAHEVEVQDTNALDL